MYRFNDLRNQKFGFLTVTELSNQRDANGSIRWVCRCICGNHVVVCGSTLKRAANPNCGCLTSKLRREGRIRSSGLKPGQAAAHAKYHQCKHDAKKRNLPFHISKDEALKLFQNDCHYCGSPPRSIQKSEHNTGNFVYNGIDRVDNQLGYSIDNCVSCCVDCNQKKSSLTVDEFINWIERAYKHFVEPQRIAARAAGEAEAIQAARHSAGPQANS